jgi:hypothetical protein
VSIAEMRALGIVIILVIGLFIAVPSHYWDVLGAVLKAAALCGTCGLLIRRYQRRH